MKKYSVIIVLLSAGIIFLLFTGCKKTGSQPEPEKQATVQSADQSANEQLFREHCVLCHPGGDGMKEMKNSDDIVKVMRHPKGTMPKFDEKAIPDPEAESLAHYIFFSILLKK